MKLYDQSQKILSRIYSLEKRIVIQFAPISLLNPMIKSLPGNLIKFFDFYHKKLYIKIFSDDIKVRLKHQSPLAHPQSLKVFCTEFKTPELNRSNGSRLRDYWLDSSFADSDVLDHITPKTYYHLCCEEGARSFCKDYLSISMKPVID